MQKQPPTETQTTLKQSTDYDSPWKEIIETFFSQFMAFFFPQAYADIDWSQSYEFLDKELQQVIREAETGRTVVDKLVKVWLNDGAEEWLLIHIEVQSQANRAFAKRMFIYNYRLFDRYEKEIISFAILADNRAKWHPKEFHYGRWGSTMQFRFATAKLLDLQTDWAALENNRNPFAIVVMVHLKAQATHHRWQDRLWWKINLLKHLYSRGYERQDVLELLRFIDWVLVLPIELEENFQAEIARFEEEQQMTYVTTWERRGLEQGLEQSIIDILELRFEDVSPSLIEQIQSFHDPDQLRALLKEAVLVQSLEEFSTSIATRQA